MPGLFPASATAFAAATLALAPAGAAAAEPVSIVSEPLSVHVGERGQLQAAVAGAPGGSFFPPARTLGDAGFFLAFPVAATPAPPAAVAGRVFGFEGGSGPSGLTDYATAAQGEVTGTGTDADPLRQETVYGVPDIAEVTQITTYVTGQREFTVHWQVRNGTSSPLAFKAIAAADFHVGERDTATAVYTNGPPRFVGGTSLETGESTGFAELPTVVEPWSHYEVLRFGRGAAGVWGRIGDAAEAAAPSLADALLARAADNAGAVEWDGHLASPLPPGDIATFGLAVRVAVPAALRFAPASASGTQGAPLGFTLASDDGDARGRTVRYAIAGANAATGAAAIGDDGTATIVDPGANPGADVVTAFVDADGDEIRDPDEAQAAAVATFLDRTPPRCRVRLDGAPAPRLLARVRCTERVTVTTRARLSVPGGRTIRLAATRTVLRGGRAMPLRLPVPAAVRARYAGAAVVAAVTLTARDGGGNVATSATRRRVRLAR